MAWTFGKIFILSFFGAALIAQIVSVAVLYGYAKEKKIVHSYNTDGTIAASSPLRSALDTYVIIQSSIFAVLAILFLIAYFRSDIGNLVDKIK